MDDLDKNLIGGAWVGGDSVTHNRTPDNSLDEIGVYARDDPSDVDQTVAAAAEALPGWALVTLQMRSDILETVAQTIFKLANELGTLLAREEGKTLVEPKGEVLRAAQIFRFFSAQHCVSGVKQVGQCVPVLTSKSVANRSAWSGSLPLGTFRLPLP